MTILTIPETYAAASVARDKVAIYNDYATRLTTAGFSPDTWSDSDYKKAIAWLFADVREGDELVRLRLFEGGFIDKAEAPYLDLLAAGWFQLLRTQATGATIRLRLTDTSNIARAATTRPLVAVWNPEDPDNALYFNAPAGIVIPKGGYVDVDFAAERTGAKYNVAPNSITSLVNPIPGVTLSSPPIAGTATIVVVAGLDAESDTNLKEAMRDKWSLLRRGWSARTIRALLRIYYPEATRVYVRDDNPLPGEAWVYLATATGNLTGAKLVEIYQFFRGENIKPLSNKPIRFFGATIEPITLDVTMYTDGLATSLLLADQRLAAYMYNYDLGRPIYREAIESTLRAPELGVQAASISDAFPKVYSPIPGASVQFTLNKTVLPAELFK